jgi:phosphomannomutase
VVVRPSGTEPKLKAYVEVVGEPSSPDVRAERERANEQMALIRDDLAQLLSLDA